MPRLPVTARSPPSAAPPSSAHSLEITARAIEVAVQHLARLNSSKAAITDGWASAISSATRG